MKLTVAVAGDICMRGMQGTLDYQTSRSILQGIQPALDSADIRIINLETAVTRAAEPIRKSGPNLSTVPQDLAFLQAGRFDCAILANNHVGDYGPMGVCDTLRSLDERGIAHVGAGANLDQAYQPWYGQTEAGRLGVLAVCENEFGIAGRDTYGAAGFYLTGVRRALEQMHAQADYVLVVMHGGNEHNPIPSPGAVDRYRSFVDFGADAVIGMHPHCPQGWETYNGAPIVYSTGNFLFRDDPQPAGSPWFFGYLPLITFEKGKKAGLDPVPYRFDPACSQISPLQGEDRQAMLAYLNRLSQPLNDPQRLRALFTGWCVIGGLPYANAVRYNSDFLLESPYPAGHPIYALRNLFTCEAHIELLRTLFTLLADERLPLAQTMADEIRALQQMPIG